MIRLAEPGDRVAVEAIVRQAYSIYIERIGKPPGPMLDDYGVLIQARAVHVWVGPDGVIAGLIVLRQEPDHLLLDNVAVSPLRQKQGIGRALICFAEREAARLGCRALRLYTHATMRENIALYRRLGFEETGRGMQAGYDRVFMSRYLT